MNISTATSQKINNNDTQHKMRIQVNYICTGSNFEWAAAPFEPEIRQYAKKNIMLISRGIRRYMQHPIVFPANKLRAQHLKFTHCVLLLSGTNVDSGFFLQSNRLYFYEMNKKIYDFNVKWFVKHFPNQSKSKYIWKSVKFEYYSILLS